MRPQIWNRFSPYSHSRSLVPPRFEVRVRPSATPRGPRHGRAALPRVSDNVWEVYLITEPEYPLCFTHAWLTSWHLCVPTYLHPCQNDNYLKYCSSIPSNNNNWTIMNSSAVNPNCKKITPLDSFLIRLYYYQFDSLVHFSVFSVQISIYYCK